MSLAEAAVVIELIGRGPLLLSEDSRGLVLARFVASDRAIGVPPKNNRRKNPGTTFPPARDSILSRQASRRSGGPPEAPSATGARKNLPIPRKIFRSLWAAHRPFTGCFHGRS
jgi:hypothetical protein